jgi:hypothetical protein
MERDCKMLVDIVYVKLWAFFGFFLGIIVTLGFINLFEWLRKED